jgi:uncharacterized protein (TIGR03067 family)
VCQWILCASVGLSIAAIAIAGETDKDEVKAIQAVWSVASMEDHGGKVPEAEVKKLRIIISEKEITAKDDGKKVGFDMTYKIDPSKKLKEIDATLTEGASKGKTTPGVYTLDGDTLTIFFADAGGTRPKEIGGKVEKGGLKYVLKREKE